MSQITDEHWEKIIIPFLKQHELKNALSIKKDEKKLVEMFGEEKELLKYGNLNLIDGLCNTEEDTTKVLEIVKRIQLVNILHKVIISENSIRLNNHVLPL